MKTRLIQKMLWLDGSSDLDQAPALLARAVELGLHRDDLVVRRILVHKMRLLASHLPDDQRPTQDDIAAAYARQSEALRRPDRRSFRHVFLNADRRPGGVSDEAKALRARLLADRIAPAAATLLGDPFPLGHTLARRSQQDLDRSFGAGFGEAVFAAEIGAWSKPIHSAYGAHLVFIDAVENGEPPPLAAVARRIQRELEHTRGEAKLEALLSDRRERYEIRWPESYGGPPATTAARPDTRETG